MTDRLTDEDRWEWEVLAAWGYLLWEPQPPRDKHHRRAGEGKRGCVGGGWGEWCGVVVCGGVWVGGLSALGLRDHKRGQSGVSVPGNVAYYNGMSGIPERHVRLRGEG